MNSPPFNAVNKLFSWILSHEIYESDEVADSTEINEEVPYHVRELILTGEEDNADRVADRSRENEPEARKRCCVEESRDVEDDHPTQEEIYEPGDYLAGLGLRIHQRFKKDSR